MRLMAFDFGLKRVGVAVSDEIPIIASPVGYVENNERLYDEIKKLLDQYKPARLVVGNPINMDGTPGKNTGLVKQFGDTLKECMAGAEVVYWDERLSSMQAEKMLIKGDVRRDKRKGMIDKISAAIILQNYMDFLKHAGNRTDGQQQ